jgi:glycosyltransferase involved in cell wall biosynthesis
MWYFSWTSLPLYYKFRKMLLKKRITMILLSNSESEHKFAKFFGFTSYFINQNIHACENDFKIIKNSEKKYDAVYTAAAKPYKRLHLAEKIKSLYIITYFWPDVRDKNGDWDLHAFEPRIKHAKFNKRRIDEIKITEILNQSRCGMALSKKEGAMWAVMEYLFCGLPIVSTKSVGGRDFFFDKRFVKIVKDTPEEVEKGVYELVQKHIDPYFIRNETLNVLNKSRKEFYNLVDSITTKHNQTNEPYESFHKRIWGREHGIEANRIIF